MLLSDAPTFPTSDPLPAFDGTPSSSKDTLERVLQVCRMWLQHLPAHDPRRKNLDAVAILVKDILESGDYSIHDAMTTARALLCTNCRRLNAAPEQCAEQSLDRCLLVKRIGS